MPRPLTDPGIGSYWTVNVTARGAKRPRKRKGRPSKDSPEEGTVIVPNEHHQHHSPDPSGPSGSMPPPSTAHHFDPSLGYPGHPVPGPHHFMQGPPSQGMPSAFGDDGESDLGDASLIDPSLDPSLSAASPDDGSMGRSEPPKATIARLRQELIQAKRQFTLATQQTSKLAEQLADVEDEVKKCHSDIDTIQTKLDEEILLRLEIERKYRRAEEGKIAAEDKLKAWRATHHSNTEEEERLVRTEIDVDADGDVDAETMIMQR